MSAINQAFGERVCRTMEDWPGGRLSLRQASIRTGVDIDTIGRMRGGQVPRMDKVIQFARGFNLDVNEWLVLAGYEPIEDASQLLHAGLYRIWQETGVIVTYNGEVPASELTPEDVREYLQIAREEAEKG